jgi:hypothetical protein
MEVASGRDAVEAAKLLLSYDVGKPPEGGVVELPPGMDANRSTLDIALETYRERLLAGEMSEAEFASMTHLLMGAEKAEAEMIARILGDAKGGSRLLKERVEALLSKLEARLGVADVPALPPIEDTTASPPAARPDAPRSGANVARPEAGTTSTKGEP